MVMSSTAFGPLVTPKGSNWRGKPMAEGGPFVRKFGQSVRGPLREYLSQRKQRVILPNKADASGLSDALDQARAFVRRYSSGERYPNLPNSNDDRAISMMSAAVGDAKEQMHAPDKAFPVSGVFHTIERPDHPRKDINDLMAAQTPEMRALLNSQFPNPDMMIGAGTVKPWSYDDDVAELNWLGSIAKDGGRDLLHAIRELPTVRGRDLVLHQIDDPHTAKFYHDMGFMPGQRLFEEEPRAIRKMGLDPDMIKDPSMKSDYETDWYIPKDKPFARAGGGLVKRGALSVLRDMFRSNRAPAVMSNEEPEQLRGALGSLRRSIAEPKAAPILEHAPMNLPAIVRPDSLPALPSFGQTDNLPALLQQAEQLVNQPVDRRQVLRGMGQAATHLAMPKERSFLSMSTPKIVTDLTPPVEAYETLGMHMPHLDDVYETHLDAHFKKKGMTDEDGVQNAIDDFDSNLHDNTPEGDAARATLAEAMRDHFDKAMAKIIKEHNLTPEQATLMRTQADRLVPHFLYEGRDSPGDLQALDEIKPEFMKPESWRAAFKGASPEDYDAMLEDVVPGQPNSLGFVRADPEENVVIRGGLTQEEHDAKLQQERVIYGQREAKRKIEFDAIIAKNRKKNGLNEPQAKASGGPVVQSHWKRGGQVKAKGWKRA